MIAEKRKLFLSFSLFKLLVCIQMEADAVNEVQLASQTEQGLHVAVYTYIAFDMHACR